MSVAGKPFVGGRQLYLAVLLQTGVLQIVAILSRLGTSYRVIADGHDPYWIGLIAAAYSCLPLVLAVPMGRYLDRKGEFRVALAAGFCVLAASLGLLFLSENLMALVIFSAIMGLGHLFCMAAGQMAMSRQADKNTAFSQYTMAASIGQVIAPLIIPVIAMGSAIPDLGLLFLIMAVLAFPLLLLSLPLRVTQPKGRNAATESGGQLSAVLRIPGVPAVIICGAIAIGANDLIIVYLPLIGAEAGMDSSFIGFLLGAKAIAAIIVRVFFSGLVRRLGRRSLLLLSIVLAALATLCFCVPMPPLPWLIAIVVLGMGLAVAITVTLAETAELAPEPIRGLTLSVRLTTNRAFQTALPLGSGTLLVFLGTGSILLWVSVSLLACAALYARWGPA